jgi:hypothetical protein
MKKMAVSFLSHYLAYPCLSSFLQCSTYFLFICLFNDAVGI